MVIVFRGLVGLWIQPIDPLNNIVLSSTAASIPIIVLMVCLILFKMPGYRAAFFASVSGFIVALLVYKMPIVIAISSYLYGVLFGLWPITWIILNAMVLFNLSRRLGSLRFLEKWMFSNLPRNKGVQAIFIAYLFGALIEGIDGYGFPIAIASAILIQLGFSPLTAVLVALLANTITVPFASLGVPIVTLSLVTGLDLHIVSTFASLQLIIYAIIIPFLIVRVSGVEKISKILDIILLSGLSLGFSVYLFTAAYGPYLTGVVAPLISMALLFIYIKAKYRVGGEKLGLTRTLYGWAPWLFVVALMFIAGVLGFSKIFSIKYMIPFLHEAVYSEIYGRVYEAVYSWSPLAHGTMVFFSIILTVLLFRARPGIVVDTYIATVKKLYPAIITILEVIGLAFLMNYSGISVTLGYTLSSLKPMLPFASALIGWVGTFITGSSTGSNALFGNLQRISAEIANYPSYIIVATNSTGGVLGKIVSLQSIAIGVSAVGLTGREGEVLKKLLPYSLALALLLGIVVYVQLLMS